MAFVMSDESLTVLESTSDCRRSIAGPYSAHRRGENCARHDADEARIGAPLEHVQTGRTARYLGYHGA